MNPFTRLIHDRRRQAGMSLVEVLIASLIIFFVFLSILPLFARAKVSNRRGGESSLMTSFLTANLEVINQSSINHSTFNDQYNSFEELEDLEQQNASNEEGKDKLELKAIQLDDPFYYSDTTNYIGLPTTYYGTGARDAVIEADAILGDEAWLNREDALSHEGTILWLKDTYLFNWDISDITPGTINSIVETDEDGNELPPSAVRVGHRKLFDNPLKWSQDNPPDMREIRVMVRSGISSSPLGTGPAMVLGYYRSY